MNATDLMMESKAVAKVLGRTDIQVEFEGSEAWNNGEVIRLPRLPAGELTPAMVSVTRGYTDHETAHSLFTDMASLDLPEKLLEITNYLEDPRAETCYQRAYPGSYHSFNGLRSHTGTLQLLALLGAETKGPLDWASLLPAAVKWTASQMMRHGGKEQDQLVEKIPEHLRPIARDYAERAMKAPNTAAVIELAKELMKEQEEEAKRQEERGAGGGDKKPEEGQDQEGQGEDEQDGQDGQAGQGGSGDAPEYQRPDVITEKGLLEALAKDSEKAPWYNPAIHVYDRHMPQIKNLIASDLAKPVGITQMGAHAKSILRRALTDVDDSRWRAGYTGGLLDPNSLDRAYQGEEDVYARKSKDPEINAVVTLLIDMSGSMRGERIEKATQTALMLAEAMETMGVPLEILGHTTMNVASRMYPHQDLLRLCEFAENNKSPNLENLRFRMVDQSGKRVRGGGQGKVAAKGVAKAVKRVRAGVDLDDADRRTIGFCLSSIEGCLSSDALVMFELLKAGDKLRHTRDLIERLPTVTEYYAGNNIDSRAIEFAVSRLCKRREPIKIVLMLCDGIPLARGALAKSLIDYTITAVNGAEKRNVTIIGVGFGESKGAAIFNNHVALGPIGQMEEVVLSVVKEVLRLGNRAKRYKTTNQKVAS